jgi:hypothetical protein
MPLAGANVVPVVIANGASLSAAAEIGAGTLVGIQLPTITTATLSFQGSHDGVTYAEVVDASANAVAYASSAGGVYIKAPADLLGVPFLKVRTGTSGSPVTQGAARTIQLIIK